MKSKPSPRELWLKNLHRGVAVEGKRLGSPIKFTQRQVNQIYKTHFEDEWRRFFNK